MRLRDRAHHRGLHGHAHISRERRNALLMIRTAQARVAVWALMLAAYAAPFPAVKHLYGLTAFVTILSLLALLLTDWGQMAASKAQLAATDAHADAEHVRSATGTDQQ